MRPGAKVQKPGFLEFHVIFLAQAHVERVLASLTLFVHDEFCSFACMHFMNSILEFQLLVWCWNSRWACGETWRRHCESEYMRDNFCNMVFWAHALMRTSLRFHRLLASQVTLLRFQIFVLDGLQVLESN
jgi:hypothetical protein